MDQTGVNFKKRVQKNGPVLTRKMVLKYSKFFTVTGAITLEPVTIRVESKEYDGHGGFID